ncbi:M20 family metallopeptidase [Halorussus marinus]|uniref:M20 family metallopeptidase n=1 Tax=Halorussus marinus TaxID=2505976 RepID=UPI0010930BF1|nr:ArgE/DapE family deacylase [Halorussus marinus]
MSGEAGADPTASDLNDLPGLAAELVRIETENPPGNERPCAEFVVEWFDHRGIDATLFEEPSAQRPQAVAEVGDREDGPTLVLNGHTDVVPAGDREAWTHDPYAGAIADGRLHGRGSADMKTGIALAMVTARDLAPEIESGDLDGSLVVHAAMGEETGDPGTASLLDAGYGGDAAVVLEPTGFRVGTRAKGVATFRVGVAGAAAHASHPDEGANAIDAARPVLVAIDEYDARLRERVDDLVGRAYATVTELSAGTDSNMAVLPERAELLLDRRILPDERFEDVEAELDDLFAGVEREAGVETDRELVMHYASAGIADDSPLAERLRRLSADRADAPTEPWGMAAATDAREFVERGIDAVIWGPGDLSKAHAVDECIDLADAATGLEILKTATREVLSES